MRRDRAFRSWAGQNAGAVRVVQSAFTENAGDRIPGVQVTEYVHESRPNRLLLRVNSVAIRGQRTCRERRGRADATRRIERRLKGGRISFRE